MTVLRSKVEAFLTARSSRHFVSWPVAAQTLCLGGGLGTNRQVGRAIRRGYLSVWCIDGSECVVLTAGPRLLAATYSS